MGGFFGGTWRKGLTLALGIMALGGASVAPAQVTPVDPNRAIDGDLAAPKPAASVPAPQPILIDPEPVAGADQGAPVTSPATPTRPARRQRVRRTKTARPGSIARRARAPRRRV